LAAAVPAAANRGSPSGRRGVGPFGAFFGTGVAKFVVFCACTQALAARAAIVSALANIFMVSASPAPSTP
jgi:hypothetical protein